MGNERLYELVVFALAAYVVLGLCFIGRPSLFLPFMRWLHNIVSALISGKITSRPPRAWLQARIGKHS